MLRLSHVLPGSLVAVAILGSWWAASTYAQQPPGWTCQIPAQAGRIIVLFNNKLIRSSQTQAVATDGPVSVAIPAGTYAITLESFDTHSTKTNPFQPHEQYFLILSNSQTTNSISDLPDTQNSLVEQVDAGFVVTSSITSVTARSTKWPESVSPKEINSIVPVCAAFDLVSVRVEPTPTLTPTPSPTPTPSLTSTPTVAPTESDSGPDNEADCCPGPDEVTTTATPQPSPRIKGISTTAATPSPTPSVGPLRRLSSTGFPVTNLILPALLLAAVALAGRLVYRGVSSR